MEELELEQKIHDYITETYKAEYKGLLKVHKNNLGYSLILGIPSYMVQTSFAIDCETDDEFLKYVYEELRVRNYVRQEVYRVLRNSETREE